MNINDYISVVQNWIGKIDPEIKLWGNTSAEYLLFLVVFSILFIVFWFIQFAVLRRLAGLAKKTKTDIDDTLIKIVRSLKPGFYSFIAFYIAIQFLVLPDLGEKIITAILLIWIAAQIVVALQILIDYVLTKHFADTDRDGEPDSIVLFMSRLIKFVLWIVAGLMVLSNLGVNVTSLMAGLGIGGLAIAFALQNIFEDLFSAFSIYLDKPFQVGDYIVAGSHSGVVEKIGIKTTRIRALQGEEVVIANKELTTSRIQNFKKLQKRRITTQFGVVYDTPTEKMRKIPDMIKRIVDEEKLARFDRVFFTTFGDSALLFELVYYIESDQYADYLAAQQGMNFKIKEVFEKEEIDMAFPTQTVHIVKG